MNRTLIVTALLAGTAFGASAQTLTTTGTAPIVTTTGTAPITSTGTAPISTTHPAPITSTGTAPVGGRTGTAPVTTGSIVARDQNQQQRIETGLQNGSISTREGAVLESQEARVDRLQSRELSDGTLSAQDKARLTRAQDHVSDEITYARNNNINGNPMSASSQREQQEVQRNINQETRIQNGVADGGLNNREVGRLENGESRSDSREYQAGRNGHVSAAEQRHVNYQDNRDSARIHAQRWDHQRRR